ncbi:C40 family peptidase [Paenibacillus aestuarii]|uniref:C40 family peptidase n=1 Tax=Paenibacillus aestuarii TaxID=516965 RepID=A0ABW0KG88_9BACL|nr:C40 family peptidase [Paenibacillus aestuarii]
MILKKVFCFYLILLICYGVGCSNQNQIKEKSRQSNEPLISLSEVAKQNNLVSLFDLNSNSYLIGETDPIYRLKANETTVLSGNSTFTLPDAPLSLNGDLLLTKASVDKLFSPPEPTSIHVQSFSHNTINPDSLISFSKQYMGTPYQFNAGPYESSRAFDCSSFVQHVFGHFGISLPRSSQEQSTLGTLVDRSNLRPGDLLFFYTPGRYSSNRIVGHLGMYIGNNEMINTYGAPGVTITPLDAYWQGRLLFAKRIG